jgi:hypothetical protein
VRQPIFGSNETDDDDGEEEDLVLANISHPCNVDKLMKALLAEHDLVTDLRRQVRQLNRRLEAIEAETGISSTRKRD